MVPPKIEKKKTGLSKEHAEGLENLFKYTKKGP
jgi:hypothetical protein